LKFLGNQAKYYIKSIIPTNAWDTIAQPMQRIRKRAYSERFEFNPQAAIREEVYVIRRRPPGGGLFSNVNHVLQGIEYSLIHGLIPVVDMENYWTTYSQKREFHGSHNAWNYFFDPVSEVDLKDLRSFQKVRYSRGDRINNDSILSERSLSFILNPEVVEVYGAMMNRYIRINAKTISIVNSVKDFIEWNPDTIGVSYRGTDYLELEPKGHARQPELMELNDALNEKVETSPQSMILVSTEDKGAKEILGEPFLHRVYKDFRDQETLKQFISTKSNPSSQVLNALGYLIEVKLLSESRTLVCSIANGSAAAILFNENRFESPIVINKGTY